jgi:hypothetical protein
LHKARPRRGPPSFPLNLRDKDHGAQPKAERKFRASHVRPRGKTDVVKCPELLTPPSRVAAGADSAVQPVGGLARLLPGAPHP